MTSDVFVSYAREDGAFVRRLHDALREQGREPWVDWAGIPPTAHWMAEIESAIVEASAFAFVLSSHSVASRVCAWELRVATEHHKRLIPLVLEEPSEKDVPEPLREIEWVYFPPDHAEDAFSTSLSRLTTALETDPEWLRFHARVETRATEWNRRGRDTSMLLRGRDLREVISVLHNNRQRNPLPTALQHEYIQASRAIEASELAQRKARELTAIARAERELGNDEVAALLARQAFLFLERHDVRDRNAVDRLLREVLGSPMFKNILSAADTRLDWIRCVAFSPDSRFLAVGHTEGALRLWRLEPFIQEPKVFRGSGGQVKTVAFSSDGNRMALGRMGTDGAPRAVEILDPGDPEAEPHIIGTHESEVHYVCFMRDGRVVSAGADGTFRVWDLSRGGRWDTLLQTPATPVTAAGMSSDEQWFAAAFPPGRLVVLRLGQSISEPAMLSVSETDVNALAFSPDSRWLAVGSGGPIAGVDDGVRLWDVRKLSAEARRLGDHPGGVRSLTFSPDGELLATGGRDGSVLLWSVDGGRTVSRAEIPSGGWVEGLAFSPDGSRLAAGNANTMGTAADIATCVWYLGEPWAGPASMGEHQFVFSLAISPTAEHIASADFDGTVRIWTSTPAEGGGSKVLNGSKASVNGGYDVAIGGDKYVVSGGADGRIRLWDLSIPEKPLLDTRVGEHVHAVAFMSAGDRFAAAYRERLSTLCLWRCDTLQSTVLAESPQEEGPVALAFDPQDDQIAAACADGFVRIWRTSGRSEPTMVLRGGVDSFATVAFSHHGRFVAAGGVDRVILIWDLVDPELPPRRLVGHAGAIEGLAFGPNDEVLAAASSDKTARVWNLRDWTLEPLILRHEVGVYDVAFLPNDSFLLTASGSSLYAWPTSTKHLAELACEAAWRNLTREEWLRYVGDDLPYEATCPRGDSANNV